MVPKILSDKEFQANSYALLEKANQAREQTPESETSTFNFSTYVPRQKRNAARLNAVVPQSSCQIVSQSIPRAATMTEGQSHKPGYSQVWNPTYHIVNHSLSIRLCCPLSLKLRAVFGADWMLLNHPDCQSLAELDCMRRK